MRLVDVVLWDNRRKKAYLVESHTLLPAVIEHTESDVFMEHPITQRDLDNCCDPDTVPPCLFVVVHLEDAKSANHRMRINFL